MAARGEVSGAPPATGARALRLLAVAIGFAAIALALVAFARCGDRPPPGPPAGGALAGPGEPGPRGAGSLVGPAPRGLEPPLLPRRGSRLRVVFFNIGEPRPYWRVFEAFLAAAARDLAIDLEVLDAAGDHLRMAAQAEEVARRDALPDFAIVNNEKRMAGRMLEALAGRGVRTLLCASVLTEPDEQARYGGPRERFPAWIGQVRPDHEGAGYLIGRRLLDEVRRSGLAPPWGVLALSGSKATHAAVDRDAGLRRAIAETPGAELRQLVHSYWARGPAHRQTLGLLRRYPDTRALWAANDPMALGALDAALASGRTPGADIFVGGLNWSGEALAEVRAGRLVTSVGGHYMGGAWALVLIRDYADGVDFADLGLDHVFPMAVLDRANVDRYLAAFGGEDWDAIDFTRFLRSRDPERRPYRFGLDALLAQLGG